MLQTEMALIVAWVSSRARAVRENKDRGDIVTVVVIIALFVAAAILIVAILVAKAKSAANKVKTQ